MILFLSEFFTWNSNRFESCFCCLTTWDRDILSNAALKTLNWAWCWCSWCSEERSRLLVCVSWCHCTILTVKCLNGFCIHWTWWALWHVNLLFCIYRNVFLFAWCHWWRVIFVLYVVFLSLGCFLLNKMIWNVSHWFPDDSKLIMTHFKC